MPTKGQPISISVPIQINGDRVTLSRRDWDRILSHISDRDVVYETQLALRPKAMPKRAYKKRVTKPK